jgi:hypothetical protein
MKPSQRLKTKTAASSKASALKKKLKSGHRVGKMTKDELRRDDEAGSDEKTYRPGPGGAPWGNE